MELTRSTLVRKLSFTGSTQVGNGTEPGTTQCPLINGEAVAKVDEYIADAIAKYAKVATGGWRHECGGNFFQPSVLTEVSADALIFDEDTFGPVEPLFRFKTKEDAIRLANNTPFVGVSEGLISTPDVPFGGVKESGLGREDGHHGIGE